MKKILLTSIFFLGIGVVAMAQQAQAAKPSSATKKSLPKTELSAKQALESKEKASKQEAKQNSNSFIMERATEVNAIKSSEAKTAKSVVTKSN